MADIIPPSMTEGQQIFASYMPPIREKDGSWRLMITVSTLPPNVRMIAHGEFRVATRDSGIALGEAIKAIVTREVPPPIVGANGN